jgi:hypothetical protein
MMTTSATGGFLFSAIRVHPGGFVIESNQFSRRKGKDLEEQGAEEEMSLDTGAEKRGLEDDADRLGKKRKVEGVAAGDDEEGALNTLETGGTGGVADSGELPFATQSVVEEEDLNI